MIRLEFIGERKLIARDYPGVPHKKIPIEELLAAIPLKGMDFPLRHQQGKFGFTVSPCTDISKLRLEDGALLISTNLVMSEQQGDFYDFGRYDLVNGIYQRVRGALVTHPERERFGEEDLDYGLIREVLFRPGTKVSKDHFTLFYDDGSFRITDIGSLTGTWVNGEKLGVEYSSWPHWTALEDNAEGSEIRKALVGKEDSDEISTFFSPHEAVSISFQYGEKTFVHGNQSVREDYAANELRRLMNNGTTELHDGDEITLGREKFGEDYKFVFHEK